MANMENVDLKWIKKHYGEKFSHLCRNLFPTILETEGVLSKLLNDHFPPSRELFDDIISNNLTISFKNYVHSLMENDDDKVKISQTPEELMDKAGYILYPECQTEEDIQSFRHYYHRGSTTPIYNGDRPEMYKGEELCTFIGGRLKSDRVWFAVKKDVDKIKREDFKYPRREDDYGVSVLSIQFSRSEPSILSIKNRYNHTVPNPDATFSNNLDNIVLGLTQAFENTYGISLANKNPQFFINKNLLSFEIPSYFQARDGKFYKYNHEINNIYYCPNNTIIQDGEVKQFDKDKAIVFEYFILDLEKKEIIDYNNSIYGILPDSFPKSVGKIKEIKRIPSKDGLTLQITPEKGEFVEIKLNKHNQIISYTNPNVEQIEGRFLVYDNSLTNINLPNATHFGDDFMPCNNSLKSINISNAKIIGKNFLYLNNSLSSIDVSNVTHFGDRFMFCNNSLTSIDLPNATHFGVYFMGCNDSLTSINAPNARHFGFGFLKDNHSIQKAYTADGIMKLFNKNHATEKTIY